MKLISTMFYCKSLKKTGKPLVITNEQTKKEKHTNNFTLNLFDKEGVQSRLNVNLTMPLQEVKKAGLHQC